MSRWPRTKARRVLAALLKIGWSIKRERGSHRVLEKPDMPDYVFAIHDNEEIVLACWRGSRVTRSHAR